MNIDQAFSKDCARSPPHQPSPLLSWSLPVAVPPLRRPHRVKWAPRHLLLLTNQHIPFTSPRVGFQFPKPEVICQLEQWEEPWILDLPRAGTRKASGSACPGGWGEDPALWGSRRGRDPHSPGPSCANTEPGVWRLSCSLSLLPPAGGGYDRQPHSQVKKLRGCDVCPTASRLIVGIWHQVCKAHPLSTAVKVLLWGSRPGVFWQLSCHPRYSFFLPSSLTLPLYLLLFPCSHFVFQILSVFTDVPFSYVLCPDCCFYPFSHPSLHGFTASALLTF